MAFYQINCEGCRHTFFRVEVRCEEYPTIYECPSCGSKQTLKTIVKPENGEKVAEENPCCHDKPTKKSSCGNGCGDCGTRRG